MFILLLLLLVILFLTGFPPLQICVGDSECLHDQVIRLIDLLEDARVEVHAHVDVGMVHV